MPRKAFVCWKSMKFRSECWIFDVPGRSAGNRLSKIRLPLKMTERQIFERREVEEIIRITWNKPRKSIEKYWIIRQNHIVVRGIVPQGKVYSASPERLVLPFPNINQNIFQIEYNLYIFPKQIFVKVNISTSNIL